MLSELLIRNYLFVEEARFDLARDMTVISGETGAGKSVLVGAIAMIFGESVTIAEPYDPSQPIYLESFWEIEPDNPILAVVDENGIDTDTDLIVAREINSAGKSSYIINGRRSTLSVVKLLKPYLIDFHHQRDQQQLLNNDYQLRTLDLYAGHGDLVDRFSIAYRHLNSRLRELKSLRDQERQQVQMMELYRFQAEELEKANLTEGEDECLQQEYELLGKADEIRDLSQSLLHDLYETENSVFDQLSRAVSRIGRYSSLDPRLDELTSILRQCLDDLSNSATILRNCESSIATDPARLDTIRRRLDLINDLKQKYRLNSTIELIVLHRKLVAKIGSYSDCTEAIATLEAAIRTDFSHLTALADSLTQSRSEAADRLGSELEANIRQLAIPDGRFEIQIDKKTSGNLLIPDFLSRCDATGQDSIELRFSGNLGTVPKPLKSVVSGGELSRILLAIKKVLAKKLHPKLMILDEIDAGIGGRTAELMAEYIHLIAASHQVLCITHLAQIAAVADKHIAIVKHSVDDKTRIRWQTLDQGQRKQEIARMLSGKITEHSVKHADELLNR